MMRFLGSLLRRLTVLVSVPALISLAACAGGPMAAQENPADLKTVSDQTNSDRRAQVRLELAVAYFSRNQLSTALDEVKQALDARPDLPEALNLRGLIYAAMSENPLAEASFRRALSLAPSDGDLMHNYAWFLCQQRRFDEADALFGRALALPQYRNFVRTMLAQGSCQARAGQLQRADVSLSRAYELDPSNLAVAFNLTEVLYRQAEYERARFYIRRVNLRAETANAQSLWLAMRVENKLRNGLLVQQLGRQLNERFPQSSEALLYEKGRYDD